MNGWLGQVPLRLSSLTIGAMPSPVVRVEVARPFLGNAHLKSAYELGKPLRRQLGQEGLDCCNLPDGRAYCYTRDAYGNCTVIWASPSRQSGAPDCVRGTGGEWTHPNCAGAAAAITPAETPSGAPGAEGGPSGLVGPDAVACPLGNDRWTLVSYADGKIIAENISRAQFDEYSNRITDLPSEWACQDSRCAPVCGTAPPVVEPPPMEPVSSQVPLPDTGESVPASGVPVLPARMQQTTESAPTGAWPGQPFSAMAPPAPPQQVPLKPAAQPIPPPVETCPLGPVPLRRWVEGCIGEKLS